MNQEPPKPMTPFDEMTIPAELQMLKLFLPYTPAPNREFLGVFIKFQELRHTISFFQKSTGDLSAQSLGGGDAPSLPEILESLKPYLPRQSAEILDTFLGFANIMEMAQMFQGQSGSSGGGGFPGTGDMGAAFSGQMNPMDMMMGMLSPEQQSMFQMYSSMFGNPEKEDNAEKENNTEKEGNTEKENNKGITESE